MMTVGEMAMQAGVTSDAVRYYVRIGLLHPKRNPENGYRLFAASDIDRLRFVVRAKALGFTLAEMRQVFSDIEAGGSPCPYVRNTLQRRIVGNKKIIAGLVALQERMETAQKEWQDIPDNMPSDKIFCHLIESNNA
ncbi:MAG: MerR family transcriptional regulator [Mariprofundaceae bacterium]|nr:MerR family transcriptional regulator [Mariprofundaceae bacterium]